MISISIHCRVTTAKIFCSLMQSKGDLPPMCVSPWGVKMDVRGDVLSLSSS